jgi:hypothetical protein
MVMEQKELSNRVVEQVAAEEGVDPTELSEPLYSVIDAEALDRLFRDSTGSVQFTYTGYEVTVTHAGEVDLDSAKAD